MLVTLKVFYKICNLKGLKEWWLKSKIIAIGSLAQAIEGRHYSRAVRLHKQSLESIFRHKYEKEIPDLATDVMKKLKTCVCIPYNNSKCNVYARMVNFARTITKKQWHDAKEGR